MRPETAGIGAESFACFHVDEDPPFTFYRVHLWPYVLAVPQQLCRGLSWRARYCIEADHRDLLHAGENVGQRELRQFGTAQLQAISGDQHELMAEAP